MNPNDDICDDEIRVWWRVHQSPTISI